MTTPYNPDDINQQFFSSGGQPSTGVPLREVTQEARPLSQADAIILKDTKDEFERTPVPPAIYDAMVDKAEFRFNKAGKPSINITWRITGPSYAGRLIWLNLQPRSNDFSAIMLKKFLTRTQKSDAKEQYHSLIEQVNTEVPFDEKKFCDEGIAIGGEAKLNIAYGKPYTNQNGDVVKPNSIKDIMLPNSGQKFM